MPTHSLKEDHLAAIASSLPQRARAIAERHWGIGREPMRPAEIADDLGLPITKVAAVIGSLRRAVSANRRDTATAPVTGPISRKKTTIGNTVLEVCGIVVTRHGDDEYKIDGAGYHSADEVGAFLSDQTDIADRKRVGGLLRHRDRWIFDGFRAARFGSQWPHDSAAAPRLAVSQN